MQISRKWLLPVLPTVCLLFLAFNSASGGQSSEWEISTTMEIPGMPFALPPSTLRHCLDDYGLPYQSGDNEECETISKKVSGDTITWQISCMGEDGRVEMQGTTRYSGDTMDTRVQMTGGQGDMAMHMTGRRLGPCK